jgi:hypothetical protein
MVAKGLLRVRAAGGVVTDHRIHAQPPREEVLRLIVVYRRAVMSRKHKLGRSAARDYFGTEWRQSYCEAKRELEAQA